MTKGLRNSPVETAVLGTLIFLLLGSHKVSGSGQLGSRCSSAFCWFARFGVRSNRFVPGILGGHSGVCCHAGHPGRPTTWERGGGWLDEGAQAATAEEVP